MQTPVQQLNTIIFGSGKFEVSPYGGAGYINLGGIRNVVFEETWDEIIIKTDNAGNLPPHISNQRASLACDLMEIDLTNLNLIRGGIDILTPIAGVPVVGYSQVVLAGSWAYSKFIPLTGQQATGDLIVVTSVTGSTDGVLTVITDYDNMLVGGVSGIMVRDSAAVTTLVQNITIVYTYTPATSKTLSSGGKYTITPAAIRVTNTNAAGQDFVIEIYKAANAAGITLNLQPDEGGEANVIPIKLTGDLDVVRTAGDMLFKITSEQL